MSVENLRIIMADERAHARRMARGSLNSWVAIGSGSYAAEFVAEFLCHRTSVSKEDRAKIAEKIAHAIDETKKER